MTPTTGMVATEDPVLPAQDMRAGVENTLKRVRDDVARAPRWVRQLMLGLAGVDLVIGVWGTLLPRSFYDNFPGGPMHWVDVLGPYNAHLVTDAGGSYLTMAVLLGLAAWAGSRRVAQVALAAVLVQAVPHATFHLTHLHGMSVGNAVGLSASMLVAVGLPCLLLVVVLKRPSGAANSETPGR